MFDDSDSDDYSSPGWRALLAVLIISLLAYIIAMIGWEIAS